MQAEKSEPIVEITNGGDEVVGNTAKIKRISKFDSIFAFTLTFMSTWEGMCSNMYFALYNGGPQVFSWSVLITYVATVAQAASLAEMASVLPIAGAQYHWTWAFAPPKIRRVTTWFQGWLTWFGWVSLLWGVANVNAGLLLSLVSLCEPSYVPKAWHTTPVIYALMLSPMAANVFAFKAVPRVEMAAGVLHVALFVIFLCVLASMGEKHTAEYVWTHFEVSSGWSNSFVAWNIGMLTSTWSLPRVMVWTTVVNGLMAYAMTIAILFASGSLSDDLDSSWPIFVILLNITGSVRATAALLGILLVVSYCVGLACLATVSRLTWAWSRDRDLHSWFASVSDRFQVPVQAVVLPTILVMLLSLLNIGSSAAFGAITALSTLALYVSYVIAISCVLWQRFSNEGSFEPGTWNMGGLGPFFNIFALVYTLWMIVLLPWPSSIPVTAANMNYASPIFVVLRSIRGGILGHEGQKALGRT